MKDAMASLNGENVAGTSGDAISFQLQSRDLPSRRVLGKGVSGIGYETTWKGKRYARKDFLGVPSDIFVQEAVALVGLADHKNIVKTYGWTTDKRSCSLLLEYLDDDLLSLLHKRTESKRELAATDSWDTVPSSTSTSIQALEMPEVLDIILQIATGMEYLHEQEIPHGDLKTKNILVMCMKDGGQKIKLVKVSDFGLVRTKRKSKPISRQVRKLDIVKWKAPEYLEILFRQLSVMSDTEETSSESDSNSESEESSTPPVVNVRLPRVDVFAADVYSFAVTCSQILTSKDPYPNLDWKELGVKILSGLRPNLPEACPPLLNNLLRSCWGDPAQRPTFSEIRMSLQENSKALLTPAPSPITSEPVIQMPASLGKQLESKLDIQMPQGNPRKMDVAEMVPIVTFGELLMDFLATVPELSLSDALAFQKAPGGAPANVAVGVCRLGGRAAFIGKVGEDGFGIMLKKVLENNGVDVRGLVLDSYARTALAFVILREDGEREFMFYRNPSADMLMLPSELDEELVRGSTIFHYGSISLISEPTRSTHHAAMKLAKESNSLLSYDPNLRLHLWPSPEAARDGIMSIWDEADIVKVSDDEVKFLTNGKDEKLDETVRELWRPHMKLLLVTDGPDGCRYFSPTFHGRVESFQVGTIDATGAGDGFVAGLLHQLVQNMKLLSDETALRSALQFACACGAITTTGCGAIPSLPDTRAVVKLIQRGRNVVVDAAAS